MLTPQVMERIRSLSPAHQEDVMKVVSGRPSLKQRFHGHHGLSGSSMAERSTYLSRFEEYAGWTIPALFPREGQHSEEMQLDYQSFGAQAVNNLANKIVTTLFHPSRPFFKAKAPDSYAEESGKRQVDIDAEMTRLEKRCMERFAERDGRTMATNAALQLIVTGNVLINKHKGQLYRHFSYRDYDAEFDSWGELNTCIVREWVTVNAMGADYAKICMQQGKRANDVVEVFTGIQRVAHGYYLVWQEIENYCVLSDNYSIYSRETLPWEPQRWMVAPGRHAGIGLVEQMSGDFHVLSKLSEADLDMLAIMLDVKTLVMPGGRTKVADLNAALPGAYVPGDPNEVNSHVHDVKMQVQYIDTKTQVVIRRLSQMFLLNSNSIRDAERVTAEEVRFMAQELDQVHGGVYSQLARTLQRPLAIDLMMEQSPMFRAIKPLIITGLESLSRLSELDNYRGFIGDMTSVGQALQGPHGAWINLEKLTKKFASGWGIEQEDVMYTPQEKQAEEQRLMQMQMTMEAASKGAIQ